MAEQDDDKSEDPTQHRRDEARNQGQITKSQDLISAGMLVIALGVIMYFSQSIFHFFGDFTRDKLSVPPPLEVSFGWAINENATAVWRLASVMTPILLLMFVAAIALNLMQTGFLFLPDKLSLDIKRINPMSGFGRLFALANFVKFGFGIIKVLIVSTVAAVSLYYDMPTILGLSELSAGEIASFLLTTAFWTSMKIAAALLILALMDYAFQWWKHEQDLKMTKQEVREEMKSLQGDPSLIARRRQVARQLAMNRMSTDVPKADFVVTNPTELAIALKYDPYKMAAPIVVAKGAGLVAQRIRRLALESNIPIVERKELARALYRDAEIDQAIPAEQYAAVAEVLRYVYELQGKHLPTMDDLKEHDTKKAA
ncbi:EscU/YscU/HrcU family type III secretion system export apparatus switch protein [Blastopirellula marina]|uniref:Flagellar biosynthetic protein FlhB n=1 Tax=Blastopirellula marina DSM 3645 TaxID=314230 RepID=A3ZNZ2_9BACT|nr:EscU/YscU/HrcU family type III secretion system export apparatus switch protein [Blastopirellula marina]EAQ82040.1 flagellar biosynthetic protein FlhB [Blastopirellula marina DSM 3645]